jgi:hypothetical protein
MASLIDKGIRRLDRIGRKYPNRTAVIMALAALVLIVIKNS